MFSVKIIAYVVPIFPKIGTQYCFVEFIIAMHLLVSNKRIYLVKL